MSLNFTGSVEVWPRISFYFLLSADHEDIEWWNENTSVEIWNSASLNRTHQNKITLSLHDTCGILSVTENLSSFSDSWISKSWLYLFFLFFYTNSKIKYFFVFVFMNKGWGKKNKQNNYQAKTYQDELKFLLASGLEFWLKC